MTRLAVFVVLAAAMAGCTTAHEATADEAQTSATPPDARTPMPQDSFPLRRLSAAAETGFRHNSRIEAATREVVRDAEAWGRLWPRLSGSSGGSSPVPQVDFGREMALVAAMGRRSAGGYEIRIVSVERDGTRLIARVVETSPGPTCGTGAALSSPADVVVVPKSDLPVQWVVRQSVMPCP
jgi:hypothetical protein